MGNYDDEKVKDSTRKNLLALRDTYGVKVAIEVARKSLKVADSDGDFKRNLNGELCEAVLEILLQDFIKTHKDWFYVKGMVLPDADNLNSEFLTEIDFVLFSKTCVFCIECKSYSGKTTLKDKGTFILNDGKTRDVYKQNILHLEVLDKMLDPFGKRGKEYQMVLFDFSSGDCSDTRNAKDKKEFLYTTEKNILSILSNASYKGNWDLEGLRLAKPKFENFSRKARAKHLAYVKSLH